MQFCYVIENLIFKIWKLINLITEIYYILITEFEYTSICISNYII